MDLTAVKQAVFVWVLLSALGCATGRVNFVGTSYPPTSHVQVFLSEDQVPPGYEVIGKVGIAAEETRWTTAENLQAKLVRTAQAKGADAIVYQQMERVSIGTSGQHSSISVFELRLGASCLRRTGGTSASIPDPAGATPAPR